ncbi:hypothetical protein [Actinophytocola algeriensis]|uniref:Uncharacterized protein n=1 Tax=Actinophytocola algeriensis TaxID=1768010 RepID=A0A7W7Q799_9PSEU|nr:hypothetical protein [Actinophytocola algeriensis]MBB4908148.1 hypothetical protein [Actinophytocola algeriensis]MBE1480178.1 hypothetical protein [Actinophytocola algeriensis]
MLTVVAFGFAWWLGLYLLARDPRKATLHRAGLGLLAYALALAADQPFLDERVHTVLLCLPAVLWTGVLVSLLPDPAETERQWLRVVLPAALAVAAASAFFQPLAGLVVVPLFWALALLLRRRARLGTGLGVLVAALLLFGLGSGLVLLGFLDDLPRTLLLAGIGLDLLLLGGCVAVLDAFDEGEAIRRDMVWSLVVAGGVAILFGSQVALASLLVDRSLELLLYGVVAAAITVQVLARPINALADRFAFRDAPDLRQERTELREVAAALPRRAPAPLFGIDDAEFARLTRRALSHYGDLGKLASSPLAALPVITDRLAARGIPDAPLARATELKAVLLETITRLKPADGDFGTSDEWRHYNALYFYYVVGVRPYSVRTKVTELDPVARRALAWFVDQVPERTLHNWQAAAAKIVAAELRAPVSPS